MDHKKTISESRQVSGFDQVSLRGNTCSAQLSITQGEREGLIIEAPPEYMQRLHSRVKDGKLSLRLGGSWLEELEDALTTYMNKPLIIYHLYVRRLVCLEVQCASMVFSSRLETPELRIKFNGTGDLKFDWFSAEKLEVHHLGSGTMRISGQVVEQSVMLHSLGRYIAPGLASKRTRMWIDGTSLARILVSQVLDVTVRGMGILEYSGTPIVTRRVSGAGQVLHKSIGYKMLRMTIP